MPDDLLKPPKSTAGDNAHRVVRVILSTFPGAADIFQWLVKPPLEKRQQQWMEDVADSLRNLEQNNNISIEDLRSNEAFVSFVVQATFVALRNHQKEKRKSLQNALINSGKGSNIEEDMQLAFLRFIDELSPTHVAIIMIFRDYQSDIRTIKSYESLFQFFSSIVPELNSREIFKMLCLDLYGRGLIWISESIEDFDLGLYKRPDLLAVSSASEGACAILSGNGRQFLRFISVEEE